MVLYEVLKMSNHAPVLEGEIVKRKLQFFWLVDYSGSMTGIKIATLNQAIREALPEVRAVLSQHPEVEMEMRAIKFADYASWHVGPDGVPIEQFTWPELGTDGLTATAQAIRLLATELDTTKMGRRGLPPVCVLVSDGHSTDEQGEYEAAIHELLSLPWGQKAVRLAIGIGEEGDYDEESLLQFVSHKDEVGVLKAHSPEQLVAYIKWASVVATASSSSGKTNSAASAGANANVQLQSLPPEVQITNSSQLF
jgi:uncharacterized protein YegL